MVFQNVALYPKQFELAQINKQKIQCSHDKDNLNPEVYLF